jgi:hypothetical protein
MSFIGVRTIRLSQLMQWIISLRCRDDCLKFSIATVWIQSTILLAFDLFLFYLFFGLFRILFFLHFYILA